MGRQEPTDGVPDGFQVLVLAVKQLFPEFEFMWLVDEAKKNLPLELDFLNEGRNAEKVAQMLKHFDFLKVGGQGNGDMVGQCRGGLVLALRIPPCRT